MGRKISSGIKIYLSFILYIAVTSFIYAFYIIKTQSDSNKIVELLIGSSSFLLLGFLYSNYIHKKGLIIGLATGCIHILLINLIGLLALGEFSFKVLPYSIFIISCGIGGILGVNFKKII